MRLFMLCKLLEKLGILARPARFERATAWFVARYSIQLSYGRVEGAYYREQVVASQGVKGQAMDATGT